MNPEFEIIRSDKFKNISPVDSLCWVQSETGWGLINASFEYKIQPQFDYLHVNPHWVVVGKNNKYGFFTLDGNQITEVNFDGDWMQYVGDDTIIVAYKKDHLIFINLEGKCIYNCDSPSKVLKMYPSGNKMIEGLYENYRKVGVWTYYKDDVSNSVRKTIEYSDSKIVTKKFLEMGMIDVFEEERNVSP